MNDDYWSFGVCLAGVKKPALSVIREVLALFHSSGGSGYGKEDRGSSLFCMIAQDFTRLTQESCGNL